MGGGEGREWCVAWDPVLMGIHGEKETSGNHDPSLQVPCAWKKGVFLLPHSTHETSKQASLPKRYETSEASLVPTGKVSPIGTRTGT